MPKIYEIYGTDAHEMTKALMSAADVADRILRDAEAERQGKAAAQRDAAVAQRGAAIEPRDVSIALKPNLILAGKPENGATTHAGVLSGCIEYLQKKGFSDISIIESSWYGEGTLRSMKVCGYDEVCEKYGVRFYLNPAKNTPTSASGGMNSLQTASLSQSTKSEQISGRQRRSIVLQCTQGDKNICS